MQKQFFLRQLQILKSHPGYRRWWVFWAIYSITLFYLGLLMFLLAKNFRLALAIVVTFVLVRLVLCELFYLFIKKQRPFKHYLFEPATPAYIPGLLMNLVNKRNNSFPSSHAATMAAIGMVIFLSFPALGVFYFVVTFLTSVGRVIVGYHYPTDIAVGWVLGVLTGWGVVYWMGPIIATRLGL